jgi:hypothetical protein
LFKIRVLIIHLNYKTMKAFENATTFFHNCESAKGWDACKDYVTENALFNAQSELLTDITKVEDYVNWMAGLVTITMPICSYKIHVSAYDEKNNTAIFFATFTGTHSGDGGPIPPSNKTTNTDYVYAIKMDDDGKVESMTKIWNSSWAMRELGWM